MEWAKNRNFRVQLPVTLLNLIRSVQINFQFGVSNTIKTLDLASSSADRPSRTIPCSWRLRIFAADSFSRFSGEVSVCKESSQRQKYPMWPTPLAVSRSQGSQEHLVTCAPKLLSFLPRVLVHGL